MPGKKVRPTGARIPLAARQVLDQVEGWSVGLYGTWYQNDANQLGWYADVWGTYGWFNNTVRGDLLPEVKYNKPSR